MLFLRKPKWNDVLSTLDEDTSQTLTLNVGNGVHTFQLKLYKWIFDLPGLASIGNVTQFNGEYGCPFCFHPGLQVRVGSGTARKYPFIPDVTLRTDAHYRDCLSHLSERKRLFGIKGTSQIFQVLKFPEDVIFDPMHALFEGLAKQFLVFSVGSSVVKHFDANKIIESI